MGHLGGVGHDAGAHAAWEGVYDRDGSAEGGAQPPGLAVLHMCTTHCMQEPRMYSSAPLLLSRIHKSLPKQCKGLIRIWHDPTSLTCGQCHIDARNATPHVWPRWPCIRDGLKLTNVPYHGATTTALLQISWYSRKSTANPAADTCNIDTCQKSWIIYWTWWRFRCKGKWFRECMLSLTGRQLIVWAAQEAREERKEAGFTKGNGGERTIAGIDSLWKATIALFDP